MQYNNQAYLSLVWKDPKERKQYLIGRLSKGEEFVFKCKERSVMNGTI